MALIQAVGAAADATTCTIASSASGSTIVVMGAFSGGAFSSVTDNQSNTYTVGTTTNGVATAWCIGANSGVTTITLVGSSGHRAWGVIEESGLSSLDANPAALQNSSANPELSNTITPAVATETAFACVGNHSNALSPATWTTNVSGGCTFSTVIGTGLTNSGVDNPGNCGIYLLRGVVTTTATFQASINVGGTNSDVVAIMSFKQSGGGGTGQPPMYTQRKVLYFI